MVVKLPNIQIDWEYFKGIDESFVDDLSTIGIILLTIVKDGDVSLIAYEIDTKKWGLLQE
jgi:hypothetical protein